MTKKTALNKVLSFGREEEHRLIKENKDHEAYQIEYARNTMIYVLGKSIKALKELFVDMTNVIMDNDGMWNYNPDHFIHDEYTRSLVVEFMKEF